MEKTNKQELFILLLSLVCAYFVIYSFTGCWPWSPNPYNSYVLQAKAWLSGRLDLGRNYSHLEIAEFGGKFFVSFPPVPSVVLLPFVVLGIPDNMVALFVSLLSGVYAYRICSLYEKRSALFWSLFLTIGGNFLLISVNAWVWFFAQNLCFLLSLMCVYYAVTGQGAKALLCWALSVGCRPHQILYLPMILFMLYQIRPGFFWKWWIAPALVAGVMMWYNFARFGSVLEFGHNYLPEFLEAPDGQFHWSYIPKNLLSLVRLPGVAADCSLDYPKFNGMALYLASPIVIPAVWCIACAAKKRPALTIIWGITAVAHLFCFASHRTMGGFQFGNRYPLDLFAYLFYMMISAKPKQEKVWIPLFLLGFGLNMVGTVLLYRIA